MSPLFKTLAATALSSAVISFTASASTATRPATGVSAMFETAPAAAFGPWLADMDGATRLRLVFILQLSDEAGAQQFVRAVSTPGSAAYGRYLNPGQFAARFGASQADYAALVAWANSHGLHTGRLSAARTSLTVEADAATINRLFNTKLAHFQTPSGKPGFAPTIMPTLPGALAGKVSGVVGLIDTGRTPTLYRRARPGGLHADNGSGVLGGFSPSDLRSIYVVPPPLSPVATQSVALFEQGGFPSTDIDVYKKQYGLPDIPIIVKGVNGSGTGDVPGVDVECDLDIDMAIGVNRKLSQVFVYEDSIDPFQVALVDALANMADDDTAQTISVSYGFDEAMAATSDEMAVRKVALQLAAQGQTVFVSSGDDGAYGNAPPALNASFPATNPYVTAVGGTTLFNFKGAYAGEEAWNLLGLGAGATGGGISTVFPIPAWQKPHGVSVAAANGGSSSMRNIPDVAAVGDPQTGVSIYASSQGGWGIYGGTSASAPIWASFASIADDARAGAGLPPLGFFNPLLYRLGAGSAFGSRDVSDGSNGNAEIYGIAGYNAGPGYDDTTGWGSINVGRYLYSVLIEAGAPGAKPGAVRGVTTQPTAGSVGVSWKGAANATGYLVAVGLADNGVAVANPFVDKVTTKTGVTIGGLAGSTAYFVYVYALNQYGARPAAAVFFTTASQ